MASLASQQALVDAAIARAPQCLTPAQRAQYYLTSTPPTLCVERKLTPYHTPEWQSWLPHYKSWLANGRRTGQEPPLPKAQ